MGTAKNKTLWPRCRDFLLGAALGFVGALVMPRRRVFDRPAEPPAPRPLEVPVEAPYEEPVRIPLHRVA